MHQLHATQGAGARDKGARECDQLKDGRRIELQDTHVGFEAAEATHSLSLKKHKTNLRQIYRILEILEQRIIDTYIKV